jgi:nucleoside-diphosphate-sugar epimerase
MGIPGTSLRSGSTVLVTGGAGFIGSHLCHAALRGGCRVRVFDNLSTGKTSNLPDGVSLVVGCVSDAKAVEDAVAGADHVFHLAAMVSVPQSVADPEGSFRSNVVGTEAVVRACIRHGVGSLVFASSAAVYGDSPKLPSSEADPMRCVSPYAAGKACGEFLLQSASCSHGLRAVSLRFFNVFGERQDPKSAYAAAISAFVDAALSSRAPVVFGTGLQTRDFVPVQDVVTAMVHAAARADAVAGRSFNVGTGTRRTLLEVIDMIAKAAGFSAAAEFRPSRPGDVHDSGADISAAREFLGYRPTADFEGAIARLVQHERRTRAGCR